MTTTYLVGVRFCHQARRRAWVASLLANLLLAGCGGVPVEDCVLLNVLPHDTQSYTQGLVFLGDRLFESSGGNGHSGLREIDPTTGEILASRSLPRQHFGEGLASVGSTLIQLTWTSHLALVYDASSLDTIRTFRYDGEGWGLCFDGRVLFMSNGSDTLVIRDPKTFRIAERRAVTLGGHPLPGLNALECRGSTLLANIYPTNRIARIDKATGVVLSLIDGRPLENRVGQPLPRSAVLNGIALHPARGTLFLTGKSWAKMFEIECTVH